MRGHDVITRFIAEQGFVSAPWGREHTTLMASPHDDTKNLDLIAAPCSHGNRASAMGLLWEAIDKRSDVGSNPLDELPPSTKQVSQRVGRDLKCPISVSV